MRQRLLKTIQIPSHSLLINSIFLIGNTLAGSFFGFLFWILAARIYEPTEVGIGAAYISALAFLTNLGEMGLGVALIRFAPTLGSKQTSFINSALVAVAGSTLLISTIFVLGTPIWTPELKALAQSGLYFGLFLTTTLLFGLAQLLDKVFIAFQVAHFVFLRNVVAHLFRIGLILTIGHLFDAIGLLLAIGVASFVSLGLSALIFAPRSLPGYRVRATFEWPILRSKLGYTLGNHLSLMLWSAPPLIYPLLIIEVLDAKATAYFYTSWMIANILFIVPTATSTSVFARAANVLDMKDKIFWQTMQRTIIGLVPIAAALSFGAPFLLGIFGDDYVTAGSSLFIYLTLSVFPYTVTSFAIAYHRVHQNTVSVIWLSSIITGLCLFSSLFLGSRYGLVGIGYGWLGGQTVGLFLSFLSYWQTRHSVVVSLNGFYKSSWHEK